MKHEEFKKKMEKWLTFFNESRWKVDCRASGANTFEKIEVDYDFDERAVSFGVPEDARLTDAVLDRVAFIQVCMMVFYSITVDAEDNAEDAVAALNVTRDFARRMDQCVYPVLRTVMQSVGRA